MRRAGSSRWRRMRDRSRARRGARDGSGRRRVAVAVRDAARPPGGRRRRRSGCALRRADSERRVAFATEPGPSCCRTFFELLTRQIATAVSSARSFEQEKQRVEALAELGMPGLNGHETARRVREEPWGEKVVLVALSGWGQEEDRRRSQEAGLQSHMVKPVDPAALGKLLGDLRGVVSADRAGPAASSPT